MILVPAHTYFNNLESLDSSEQSIVDSIVEKMLSLHNGLEILCTDWNQQNLHPNFIQYMIDFRSSRKCLQFYISTGQLTVMLYDSI
ncbi:MAG: hypothetical protein HRU07_06540 [Nitrosopumilus sp.]|nr:hypothetical protein [Nitrosopumilus sp.]NRA05798.1 hypothetical protein [Nitrosopumilus sp.]